MVKMHQVTRSSVFNPLALGYSIWSLVECLAVISFLVVFASVKEKIPIPVIEAPPIEPSRTLSPPSEEPERSRRRKRTVSFSDVVDVRIIGPFYAEQMPRSGTGELFDRKTEHAVFDVRLTPHLSIMQLLHCKETVFENFATEKEHTVPVEPRPLYAGLRER
jgi:hypothetical protein